MSLLARRLQAGYSAGGGGGFSPDDVTGLIVWLDADAIGGLSDTDAVSTWSNDAPGSSETYTKGLSANQPTYRTNIQNSLPVVRFDGNDSLAGTVSRTLKPCSIFVAMSADSVAGPDVIVGNTTGNGAMNYRTLSSKMNALAEATANIASSTTTITNTTFYVVDFTYSSSGGYVFGLDGTDDGSGTSNQTISASAIAIGARDDSTEVFDGDIGEILIYDNVVSSGDKTSIRNYLTTKWGV